MAPGATYILTVFYGEGKYKNVNSVSQIERERARARDRQRAKVRSGEREHQETERDRVPERVLGRPYLELRQPLDGFEGTQHSEDPQGLDGVDVLTLGPPVGEQGGSGREPVG